MSIWATVASINWGERLSVLYEPNLVVIQVMRKCRSILKTASAMSADLPIAYHNFKPSWTVMLPGICLRYYRALDDSPTGR